MKKIILSVIIILVVGIVIFFVFKSPRDTESNIYEEKIITLEQDNKNDYYTFYKLQILTSKKKIRLYFNKIKDNSISNNIILYVYDKEYNILDSYNINLYEKEEYVELDYNTNLDNALYYSVDLISGNASSG